MRATHLMRVASVFSFSALLSCSSGDTVVAVNALSSNDTQYNGDTKMGSLGGLLDPGIPDNILHPNDPTATSTLRKAVTLRFKITQGSLTTMKDVTPVGAKFKAPVLDATGMPVLDPMQMVTVADHTAIAQFYTRITLTSAWNDGPTMVTAEALDAMGQSFFSAKPVTIDLKKNGATAAFLDFVIPSPMPPPAADGGSGDATTDSGAGSPDGGSVGGGGAGGRGVGGAGGRGVGGAGGRGVGGAGGRGVGGAGGGAGGGGGGAGGGAGAADGGISDAGGAG